jgi:hypothetical protein
MKGDSANHDDGTTYISVPGQWWRRAFARGVYLLRLSSAVLEKLWFVKYFHQAPAGGAAAAAPEGGALAGPSALTPTPSWGCAGNPIVVPCMAHLGARRRESGSCDPRDHIVAVCLSKLNASTNLF